MIGAKNGERERERKRERERERERENEMGLGLCKSAMGLWRKKEEMKRQ